MSSVDKSYLVNPNAPKRVKRLLDQNGQFSTGRRKVDYNYALVGFWGSIMPMLIASSLSDEYPWVFFITLPIQLLTIIWMVASFVKAPTKRQRSFKRAQKLNQIVEIPFELREIYDRQCQRLGVEPSIANLQNEFAVVKEQLLPALTQLKGCGARDNDTSSHLTRYLNQQLGRIADGQRIEVQNEARRRELEAQNRERAEQDASSLRLTRAQAMFPLDDE